MFYWGLKRFFPNDSEYTLDRFRDLPFEYVIISYSQAVRLTRLEMHMLERPLALQTQIYVNGHKDPKKSKPAKIEEFYLYQPTDIKNLPSGRNGAAALSLIQQNQFPLWALFCYKELASSANASPPELLCFKSDTAILLAPQMHTSGYSGMLIALEEAANKVHVMRSPCGKIFTAKIGAINTKVIAQENVTLFHANLVN